MTAEEGVAWYDRHIADRTESWFAIYELSTWRAIGQMGLFDIDHQNRRAEFGIIIGEEECRGKGYGTEAAPLVLDYAFTARGIQNVMLTVNEFNRAALRAYEKAGFREFGRRRQCRYMGGRFWDVVYMDCVASEFTGSRLAEVFAPDDEL